jgi:hypothetical protein
MSQRYRLTGSTFVLLALAAAARAEVTDCTEITSVPYHVNAPGTYCLKGSLALPMSGFIAVQIYADDVVLDLNGHTLDGSGAGPATTSMGVRALKRRNVTVRNGTIRGFATGVYLGLGLSQGHVIEKLRLDSNTEYGLIMDALGGIVRHNLVVGTGGSTQTDAVGPYALYASGAGAHVIDNEVVHTVEAPGGTAFGIIVEQGEGAVIERNVVSNASLGPSASTGIRISASRVAVVGNRVTNMRKGIHFSSGPGIYMDNTVANASAPFTGGTAAGATNFSY